MLKSRHRAFSPSVLQRAVTTSL